MEPIQAKKILLVEDDPFLSSLLRNRLIKEKVEVINAKDGQEALDTLKTFKPDLILLDLILPKKSGFEVMEGIKQDPQLQSAPIIIISNLFHRSNETGLCSYRNMKYYYTNYLLIF